jgi:3-hydroxyacyl-[acyl-carrier-protein] dehydratase
MAKEIFIDEIMAILPHRYPFLLLDRVIEIELAKYIVGIKNVTINEPFFLGHFPEQPVMPGVLMLEALAQLSGILTVKSDPNVNKHNSDFYFAAVENARFKRVVMPGDQLKMTVEILWTKKDIYKFSGKITVANELACSAEFMTARRDKT